VKELAAQLQMMATDNARLQVYIYIQTHRHTEYNSTNADTYACCFTSTTVQILTARLVCRMRQKQAAGASGKWTRLLLRTRRRRCGCMFFFLLVYWLYWYKSTEY
jgi:hypothetical protein